MFRLVRKCILSQLGASLSVLNDCLVQCPVDRWEGQVGTQTFWHVAYHTLFFTDLYLSPDESSFQLPSFHREDYQFFGKKPWPPYEPVAADVAYDKDILIGYVEQCRQKARASIEAETSESLEGPCRFWWYEVPRAEFYLIVIRHAQHHAAQMSLYLRNSASVEIDWVATG